MTDCFTEPGRSVADDGRLVYAWPPEGRFAVLWTQFDQTFSDSEKCELLSLLTWWHHETSTLVAYTDENGEWVDVEPRWNVVEGWLA